MLRLFFALISLTLCLSVHAAQVDNLYQASAAVNSQSLDERESLTPDLLRQVFLKVVGDSRALDIVDLSPVLTNANDYVQQYHYERTNVISEDLTAPDELALVVSFNESTVNQAISSLGLPIWGKLRPETLIWMALDIDGNQRLSNGYTDLALAEKLAKAAYQRGIPFLFPAMDLQDQMQLNFNDVHTGNMTTVQSASARYAAPVVMAMSLSGSKSQVNIRWQALINNQLETWQSQGELDSAIQSGVGALADILARGFNQIISSSESQRMTMQISNVRDYADYVRLLDYMAKIDYVSHVDTTSLTKDVVTLDIRIKGEKRVFEQTLAIGDVLRADDTASQNGLSSYRFLP